MTGETFLSAHARMSKWTITYKIDKLAYLLNNVCLQPSSLVVTHPVSCRPALMALAALGKSSEESVSISHKSSVIRWLDYLFNIWPVVTMKSCPIALKV